MNMKTIFTVGLLSLVLLGAGCDSVRPASDFRKQADFAESCEKNGGEVLYGPYGISCGIKD